MFQKRRSQKPIIEVVCVYIGKSDSCKENRTRSGGAIRVRERVRVRARLALIRPLSHPDEHCDNTSQ